MQLHKYNIIYADPPWKYYNFENSGTGEWVGDIYPLMKTEDICSLPIKYIASENCVLFIWCTPPCFPEVFKVIKAWGFQYKTKAFCWVKMNKTGFGVFTGQGYWTRSNTEDCLLAVRGHPQRISKSMSQVLLSPIQEHSHKPAIIREKIIELMGDLPRIELFARQKVKGWNSWGNEIECDIDLKELKEITG
jgi:site-specific DNA-methyltransferase (adenine-specific)